MLRESRGIFAEICGVFHGRSNYSCFDCIIVGFLAKFSETRPFAHKIPVNPPFGFRNPYHSDCPLLDLSIILCRLVG